LVREFINILRLFSILKQLHISLIRASSPGISGSSLLAAVRSFLYFSQLSAWLSLSDGRQPPHVIYRLTVSSPVFCSKFESATEEHVFPLARFGTQTSIRVCS